MYNRVLSLSESETNSLFLFGARQTGKTSLLRERFPKCIYYDLLEFDTMMRFRQRPSLLRDLLMDVPNESLVVIDEIQQVPELLNEIHLLISRKQLRFILCGSSARKLRRNSVNTLGGRALPTYLYPLVSAEIPDFNLIRAVNNGMMPAIYPLENPRRQIQAYVDVYLKEEIMAEALVRNLMGFSNFLRAAAITNGEIVNYQNIAQDCGVGAKTVKEYFSILTDTLIGYMIPAYTRTNKRSVVQAPRFYFFDVSIPNFMLNRSELLPGSPEFGHAFEHFFIQELVAYLGYHNSIEPLSYWRTYTGLEVDAVIGEARVAIEFKSVTEVRTSHLKNLKRFAEDFPNARLVIVTLDKLSRKMGNVESYYAYDFLKLLWEGKII
ncbi:MAG: ATP-binding protein [Bacteroidales bacterium]|nr:ATP-binding protein [Bacteroidales bacterium]